MKIILSKLMMIAHLTKQQLISLLIFNSTNQDLLVLLRHMGKYQSNSYKKLFLFFLYGLFK